MGIGTSKGAFYEDQFHYAQSQWDPKYDDNVVTPDRQRQNKQLDDVETNPATGMGIEVNSPKINNRFGATEIADRTTSSPLVTITDDDVDKAMGLGMSFSGGGLTTKGETVGKAALKYKGDLFEDSNHGLALNKLLDKHPADGLSFSKIEEGFTTSSGRFVDRYEAAKIARDGKQIDSSFPDEVMLLSENLSNPK